MQTFAPPMCRAERPPGKGSCPIVPDPELGHKKTRNIARRPCCLDHWSPPLLRTGIQEHLSETDGRSENEISFHSLSARPPPPCPFFHWSPCPLFHLSTLRFHLFPFSFFLHSFSFSLSSWFSYFSSFSSWSLPVLRFLFSSPARYLKSQTRSHKPVKSKFQQSNMTREFAG